MYDRLFLELKKRAIPRYIYEDLFDEQKQVVDEPSRFIAILTPRRAAKSWTICSLMLIRSLSVPNSRCLFLGLTRTSVKRIAWDILNKILDKYNIKRFPNRVDLTITFENGSSIELGGADSTTDAAEKYLGAAYDVVAIDESGSFSPEVLDYLIDVVISPTLVDRLGKLVLAGTPRAIESGRFYQVTTSKHPRWTTFTWNTSRNPYTAKQWKAEINEIKKAKKDIEKEAWFIREYMGRWAKDDRDMVYKFSIENLAADVPKEGGVYNYVLGVDIGWTDDCAFVVAGWSKHNSNLFVFESYKKPEMLPNQIAAHIKQYADTYQPLFVVADGQNKTVIEELKRRYGALITPAQKTNKKDWIELLNVDFLLNKIHILQGSNALLIKELSELPWDIKPNGERKEHAAFANHCTDALLYAFRYSYHYKELPVIEKDAQTKIYEDEVKKAQQRAKKKRWER